MRIFERLVDLATIIFVGLAIYMITSQFLSGYRSRAWEAGYRAAENYYRTTRMVEWWPVGHDSSGLVHEANFIPQAKQTK